MFVLEFLIKVIIQIYNPLDKVFSLRLIVEVDLDALESLDNLGTLVPLCSHVSHVLCNFTRRGGTHFRSWAERSAFIGNLNTMSLRKCMA
mgnify:FL=1